MTENIDVGETSSETTVKVEDGVCLLAPYRVLDLSDEKGYLCGKILAGLGADVLKVEPPGGEPGRMKGPFYHDQPHPEKSLSWFAFNMNKRGITLNIETADGQSIFKRLAETADFVIESFPVGYLAKLGLGYPMLSEVNRRLILTSISPFGQTGPYKDFKTSDIVALAMGGLMYLCGDSDRPPARISSPQGYLHAGIEAAVASLVAHHFRQKTGEGQHVDISIQQSIVCTTFQNVAWWQFHKRILKRVGAKRTGLSAAGSYRQQWHCKDGYVSFAILGGLGGIKSSKALTGWIKSEGMADDFLNSVDWDNFDMAKVSEAWFERISEPLARFFLSHTKAELYEGALKRRIMLYPVNTPRELLESMQLKSRDYWTKVEHPELNDTITYPGQFMHASGTHGAVPRRAPLIGEHNEEIYGEIGLSSQKLVMLKQAGII